MKNNSRKITGRKKINRLTLTLLIPTLWLAALACSANRQIMKEGDAAPNGSENSVAADSSARVKSPKAKAADEQYLVVKFRQNDTEVEMALDPNSTNLDLELLRGKDGVLSVTKGDSVLYKKDDEPKTPPQPNPNSEGELLTDEIIRDINLAQKLFYERRYAEALNVLQASLQKKKTATAYALGGSIYFVNGEIESAVQAWENALQINPNLEDVRQLIARYKTSR
jgi:tetratricopeptide (TPR) repeat protein